MTKIILNNNITFSIEPFEKKARVFVYKKEGEWVCRKETIKNIEAFLKKDETSIFKGRLQLYKANPKIFIEMKKEMIGSIKQSEFVSALENVKQLLKKPNNVTEKAIKSAKEGKTKKYDSSKSLFHSLSK